MEAECPTCGKGYNIPDDRIPPDGTTAKCRECGGRFMLLPADPPPPETPQPTAPTPPPDAAKMTCPKCDREQPQADMCMFCGIVPEKWQRAQAQQQTQAKQETPADEPEPAAFTDDAETPETKKPAESASPGELTAGEAVLGCFVDFGFTENVTPALLKLGYALTVVVGLIVALVVGVMRALDGEWFAALGALFGYAVLVVYSRVMAEFLLVAFKIERNTRR